MRGLDVDSQSCAPVEGFGASRGVDLARRAEAATDKKTSQQKSGEGTAETNEEKLVLATHQPTTTQRYGRVEEKTRPGVAEEGAEW